MRNKTSYCHITYALCTRNLGMVDLTLQHICIGSLYQVLCVCVCVCVCCAHFVSFSKLDLRARQTVIAEKVGSILKNAPQDNVKNVTGLIAWPCMRACVSVCVCAHVCACTVCTYIHVCVSVHVSLCLYVCVCCSECSMHTITSAYFWPLGRDCEVPLPSVVKCPSHQLWSAPPISCEVPLPSVVKSPSHQLWSAPPITCDVVPYTCTVPAPMLCTNTECGAGILRPPHVQVQHGWASCATPEQYSRVGADCAGIESPAKVGV